MLHPDKPAVILAPMDGLTDAPMRAVQGEIGAFTYAVSEFVRISANVPGSAAFTRNIPEVTEGARTRSGLPVQVQILGGDAPRMAASAKVACDAGAQAIDINFGCPAPTVNSHDGGATLLKYPHRIREIVRAVRDAVPADLPVSAKLRLGWESPDDIYQNAQMAADGGASWITIHARTRAQGYQPPVRWRPIGIVRESLDIPVVANGDIWTVDAFRRCRDETGCRHFMLGRGALADPRLSHDVAAELGIPASPNRHRAPAIETPCDWRPHLQRLADYSALYHPTMSRHLVKRLKGWLKIAAFCGNFSAFDAVKRAETVEELFALLATA